MPNLTALSANMTKATALANLILVTPQAVVGYQPQNPPNTDGTPSTASPPPSFLFDYEGEQTLTIDSDITDHYIEDNRAIQDQVALRPETFTTHGFVGELNDVTPDFLKPVKFAADKLTAIGAYTPALSTTALIAYSEAILAYQTAANIAHSAVAAWDTVGNFISGSDGQTTIGSKGIKTGSSQNNQQTAFQKFYGYWNTRTLFTIQTPWAVFQDMAIKTLRAVQDDTTRVITDFEITFKRIRTASTATGVNLGNISLSGRLGSQSASPTNLGTSSPVSSTSLPSGLVSMGVA